MPAQQTLRTTKSPTAAWSCWRQAGLIGLVSAAFFTCGLRDTSFVDEYAYITQSYQPDLVFSGHMNDPSWLEPLAYDLVPLPKLWTNLAFRAAGIPRPSPWNAVPWYRDTSHRWGTERELIIARLPSVILGTIGCMAIFALGSDIRDHRTGVIAAFLLAINPLYSLHAHRAMSETGCEAFMLIALALGLKAWKAMLARTLGDQPAALARRRILRRGCRSFPSSAESWCSLPWGAGLAWPWSCLVSLGRAGSVFVPEQLRRS